MKTAKAKSPKVLTAEKLADVLRSLADRLVKAVDEKYINRTSVDADTLSETLLSVADEIEKE